MLDLIKKGVGYVGVALWLSLAIWLVKAGTEFINASSAALDKVPAAFEAVNGRNDTRWTAKLEATGGTPPDTIPMRPRIDADRPPSGHLDGSGGGPVELR